MIFTIDIIFFSIYLALFLFSYFIASSNLILKQLNVSQEEYQEKMKFEQMLKNKHLIFENFLEYDNYFYLQKNGSNYTGLVSVGRVVYLGPISTEYIEQKMYFVDGKFHNENGPAIIDKYENRFHLNGSLRLSKEEWFSRLSEEKQLEMLWHINDWE